MSTSLTIQELLDRHGGRLQLQWLAGQVDAKTTLKLSNRSTDPSLVGYFNIARPNQVEVFGSAEIAHLRELPQAAHDALFQNLYANPPVMIIVADGEDTPEQLVRGCESHAVPLFSSRLSGPQLVRRLQQFLAEVLAERVTRHGVFMEVLGQGVLISGQSGIGKSELALELLSRGHRLIADDAPEFYAAGADTLRGTCPPVLQDFLEVRGLGILNIRAMFGATAILPNKRLRLIIKLTPPEDHMNRPVNRLTTISCYQDILDVTIPEIQIPVAPGRNLAVILEAAVQNHVLYLNGYSASDDFIQRQKQQLQNSDS
jgi:HPr kinase/phosphorylase